MAKKETQWVSSPVPNLIKSRKSGTYYGQAKVENKPYRKSLKTKDYKVAQNRLEGFMKQVKRLRKAAKKNATGLKMGQLIDLYRKSVEKDPKLKEGGRRAKLYSIKRLETSWPELREFAPGQLEFEDVQKWVERLSSEGTGFVVPKTGVKRAGNSSSSVNKAINQLAGVLDLAQQKGIVSENVARVRGLKIADTAEKGNLPSREDFARVIMELSKQRDGHAAYCARFLSLTGCRIDEARNVLFKHADFGKRELFIDGTKTKTSSRTIPMSYKLRLLLASYRMELLPKAGPDIDKMRVFPLKDLNRVLEAACKKLKIARFTNHDLRDYFATSCLEEDIPAHTVAGWIGHSDGGALLLKTYAHLRDAHARKLAENLDF